MCPIVHSRVSVHTVIGVGEKTAAKVINRHKMKDCRKGKMNTFLFFNREIGSLRYFEDTYEYRASRMIRIFKFGKEIRLYL